MNRVEALVEFFLEALEQTQPEGPYVLGGHSAGTHIALALALALQQQGHEVPMLVLLDMAAPGAIDKLVDELSLDMDEAAPGWETMGALVRRVEVLKRQLGDKLSISLTHLQTLSGEEALQYVSEAYEKANLLSPQSGIEQLKRIDRHFLNTMEAIRHYVPQDRYHGQLLLFQTHEMSAMYGYQLADEWQAFCTQPVVAHTVSGNHLTLLSTPHVESLTRQIREALNRILPP